MPKSQEFYPKKLFAKGKITFPDIPVNVYSQTLAQEKKSFSKKDFLTIYHDLCVIREFETVLDTIKKEGKYKGVEYNHRGPAHLSIGQEASAVGQAYNLKVEDHIFGSHRSHGEILAKGFAAIRELEDKELTKIMENFLDGSLLKVVERY